MILYADTSALMKLVLEEPGSSEMEHAAGEVEGVSTAGIGYAELRAALASALRSGRVAQDQRTARLQALEDVWEHVLEIPLDRSLLRYAGDLAEGLALRGYDAVHLAALTRVGSPSEVTLACWEADLRRAAQQLGYPLFPA